MNIDPDKGLTLSATDSIGQSVTYQYDAANRLTCAEAVVETGTDMGTDTKT